MNRYATIVLAAKFEKVTYYTVEFENSKQNEFEDFISRIGSDKNLETEYYDLLSWLKKIGNELTAQERYFRQEQNAHALPPPARYIEATNDLRLYCVCLSSSVVVLFNGAKKTTKTAQECPNVRPYFQDAVKLTQAIDAFISEKEIIVGNKELIINKGIELEI